MPNSTAQPSLIHPQDIHNRALIKNVHPLDWVNPTPSDRPYPLVIIGAGTAGLVTAAIAAALGARVALIERHLMGGDCLNFGCVPSKSLLHSAKTQSEFTQAMERLRSQRASISQHDSVQRFTALGVDVFLGSAQFIKDGKIQIEGDHGTQTLYYKKAVICTGARAFLPPIPGLQDVNPLTNETVFSLTEQPKSLGIIGSGPIGCELAQAFAKLGTHVTLLDHSATILPRENPAASRLVQKNLADDGVNFRPTSTIDKVTRDEQGITLHYRREEQKNSLCVDQLLVAAGRSPNVSHLNLDTVGVQYDQRSGVTVNRFLQTSNANIYAAGDICFPYKFTHTADVLAQIVIQNALFPHPLGFGKRSTDALIIPWCTYTTPEVAHVGQYAQELDKKHIDYETIKVTLDAVDRAILDEATDGFAEIHLQKGTDKILGATIVADNAGDIISSVSILMSNRLGLKAIGKTIFPYPTQAEVLKKITAQWQKNQFTARKKRWLQRIFRGWK